MNEYTGAAVFFKSIQPDERVFFLVRHGERGHILPNDPYHGALVGLTDHGREQALNLGRVIAAGMEIQSSSFFSSPVGRCMETAQCIAKGMGLHLPDESLRHSSESRSHADECKRHSSDDLRHSGEGRNLSEVTPCQPLAEFFVEHYDAYMETHRTGFYQGICRWLDGSAADPDYVDPAYFPLARRSEEMLQLMLENGSAHVNIFATHDAWIVPCLAHFCGLKFTPQLWMNFLTGMAVVTRGEDACGKPKVDRIAAVTGLENGNLVFG